MSNPKWCEFIEFEVQACAEVASTGPTIWRWIYWIGFLPAGIAALILIGALINEDDGDDFGLLGFFIFPLLAGAIVLAWPLLIACGVALLVLLALFELASATHKWLFERP